MKLIGKKALVTGGAKRVGRAIAVELANAGCDVAIHYHSSKTSALELAAKIKSIGRRSFAVCGDLASPHNWDRIVDKSVAELGGLDVLINNASVFSADGSGNPASNFNRAHREVVYRVNVLALAALCHRARPHLEKNGGGAIVNLSDISASKPWPGYLAYCSSKAALNAVTTGLAKAFAPTIRVNAVAPGIAVFPEDYDHALRKKLVDRVPLGREGTPQEVAKLIRFLCEDGDYITGQIIAIDGGRSLVW